MRLAKLRTIAAPLGALQAFPTAPNTSHTRRRCWLFPLRLALTDELFDPHLHLFLSLIKFNCKELGQTLNFNFN
jgi:hypothetical protein